MLNQNTMFIKKLITIQQLITPPLDDRLAPLQLKKTPNNAVKNMH